MLCVIFIFSLVRYCFMVVNCHEMLHWVFWFCMRHALSVPLRVRHVTEQIRRSPVGQPTSLDGHAGFARKLCHRFGVYPSLECQHAKNQLMDLVGYSSAMASFEKDWSDRGRQAGPCMVCDLHSHARADR